MSLPREWSRGPQWASEKARREWGPVLERAQRAWGEIELGSVSERFRPSALVHVTPDELVQASRDTLAQRLQLTPVAVNGTGLRAAVHRPGLADVWHQAWSLSHTDSIGELLGYPRCCVEFFRAHWERSGHRDVVPFMGAIAGPWESNILLRWLGVRLVAHLPCSAACTGTLDAARGFLEVGRKIQADVEDLERVLRLRVRYESWNGVTVVETPHFRVMAGGVPGPVHLERSGDPGPWEDNGFAKLSSQEAAHQVVAAAVGQVGSALDLGCGDGALLARLAGGRHGRWVGVDQDRGRALRGLQRHSGLVLTAERIQDWAARYLAAREAVSRDPCDSPYDVVLLMPGRLLELPDEQAVLVRLAAREAGRRIVLYAYGEWLERHGSLEALARAAGYGSLGAVSEGHQVAAAEVRG